MTQLKDVLTIKEAAAVCGLSQERLRQFCQEERLGRKFGMQWMIERQELEEFMKIERKPGRPWE